MFCISLSLFFIYLPHKDDGDGDDDDDADDEYSLLKKKDHNVMIQVYPTVSKRVRERKGKQKETNFHRLSNGIEHKKRSINRKVMYA